MLENPHKICRKTINMSCKLAAIVKGREKCPLFNLPKNLSNSSNTY